MNINLTLLGQAIAFALFVWFCMRFVWPPLVAAMRARQQDIAERLDTAARAQEAVAEAQREADELRNAAQVEAVTLVGNANQTAARLVEDAKAQAVEERERTVRAAQGEIDQAAQRAREALREELAELLLAGADKVLGEPVDRELHRSLVDRLSAKW